jgi:hypothetical protein
MDREKLAASPVVLSKKRSILRSKPNVMEVAPEVEDDVKSYTTESNSVSQQKGKLTVKAIKVIIYNILNFI